MRRSHLLRGLAVGCCVAAVGACGRGGGASFDVGLQRVALDLAFKDAALAKPKTQVPPERQLGPLTVPSQAQFALTYPDLLKGDRTPRNIPIPKRFLDCPEPPRNAVPHDLAASSIDRQIKTGRYLYKFDGSFDLEGPITFKGKLGPYLVEDYGNAGFIPASTDALSQPVSKAYTWDVVQPLGNGNFVRRSFRATDTALQLAAITYHLGDDEVTFKPTPAVTMMDLGANLKEGATWYSGGTDMASKTSIIVNGGVVGRELVKACGVVYDAWKIKNSERIVSLAGTVPFTSFTDDANNPQGEDETHQPNYYWVGTQFGGLFLGEEIHTTTTLGATTLLLDGRSTIMSIDPPSITLGNG
jgi:hypothetical protein